MEYCDKLAKRVAKFNNFLFPSLLLLYIWAGPPHSMPDTVPEQLQEPCFIKPVLRPFRASNLFPFHSPMLTKDLLYYAVFIRPVLYLFGPGNIFADSSQSGIGTLQYEC